MLVPSRISGPALVALARLAKTRVGAAVLYRTLRAELCIDRLDGLPDTMRADVPLDTRPLQARARHFDVGQRLPYSARPWSTTADKLTGAYRGGALSPVEAVRVALDEGRKLSTRAVPGGPMLETTEAAAIREAEDSERRYRAGKPIGPLDGVPFVVKEQTAVRGCARRAGTTYIDGAPQREDATCVARLRAAGAIVLGTTVMTEYGMSPMGFNPHRAMPRNPHADGRLAGGSSTGSGVAVATGLVAFGLGADGGGSIRIPAAMNGVFGIKPTWGRVSRTGDISTGSVAHLGPIASSTLDLARVLEAVGARDPRDAETREAPPLEDGSLVRALGRGVRGLRIGVDDAEWGDASPDVGRAGESAILALEREGATVVRISIAGAKLAPAIGYVSIGVESLAALRSEWRQFHERMGPDLQITFAALSEAGAREYVDAQRLRAGLRLETARVFGDIDLLALPTTRSTAPHATAAQAEKGFLDAHVLDGLCRYTFLANLTGLPAISVPVGQDALGLPIGFQLVGDAWDEATVLAAAAHLERIELARVPRPAVRARLPASG